jgi:hypothetical protein
MQDATPDTKQYQCRHIFTDGHRCASPCLRQEEFCYYHHTTRKPVANPRQRRSRRSTFHLPLPEDRSAIQSSIGQVLQRIASNDIDPRRAGLLLYGLQIASLNLPKPQPRSHPSTRYQPASPYEPETANQTVEEITIDPALGVLAPRTEIGTPEEYKSPVRKLIEKLIQRDEEEKAARLEPVSIPTIQAAIETTQESCRQPVQTPSNSCRSGVPAASHRLLEVKGIVHWGKENLSGLRRQWQLSCTKSSAKAIAAVSRAGDALISKDSGSGQFSGSRNPGQCWQVSGHLLVAYSGRIAVPGVLRVNKYTF